MIRIGKEWASWHSGESTFVVLLRLITDITIPDAKRDLGRVYTGEAYWEIDRGDAELLRNRLLGDHEAQMTDDAMEELRLFRAAREAANRRVNDWHNEQLASASEKAWTELCAFLKTRGRE